MSFFGANLDPNTIDQYQGDPSRVRYAQMMARELMKDDTSKTNSWTQGLGKIFNAFNARKFNQAVNPPSFLQVPPSSMQVGHPGVSGNGGFSNTPNPFSQQSPIAQPPPVGGVGTPGASGVSGGSVNPFAQTSQMWPYNDPFGVT